jgi:hypothetical protein
LEYDLRRYLQVDVRGLFTHPRTITYRQVIVWIRHLPADSALAIRGLAGEVRNSFNDAMSVAMVNELRVLNWRYLAAHSDEKPEQPHLIQLAE